MKNFKKAFTYNYWHSNDPDLVESKFKLIGLLFAVLVSILIFVSLKMSDNRWNKRVENITEDAAKKQEEIKSELDSANIVNWQTQRKVFQLQGSLKEDSIRQSLMNNKLNEGFNEILKINENNYIPDATVNEQLDFIRTVRHKEYR